MRRDESNELIGRNSQEHSSKHHIGTHKRTRGSSNFSFRSHKCHWRGPSAARRLRTAPSAPHRSPPPRSTPGEKLKTIPNPGQWTPSSRTRARRSLVFSSVRAGRNGRWPRGSASGAPSTPPSSRPLLSLRPWPPPALLNLVSLWAMRVAVVMGSGHDS